jgi:hypothetical protein
MRTRKLVGTLIGFWLLTSCVTFGAIRQAEQPFANDTEFRDWFAFYYQHPQPDRITVALKFMGSHQYLDENSNKYKDMPLIASVFLGRIFAINEDSLSSWVTSWQSLNEVEWYVVLVALHMAEHENAKKILAANLTKVDDEHQKRLIKIMKTDSFSFDPLAADIVTSRQINLLWSAFSATGDIRYVKKVITQIHHFGDEEDNERQIGEAALMSLANNALQHEVVGKLCLEEQRLNDDSKTRLLLEAMITAIVKLDDHADPRSLSH